MTANPPATPDYETFQVARTVHVRAPRSVVWAALTQPEQISQWFGESATFPDGVGPGSLGSFSWTGHGEFPVRIERFEPESHFDFTWGKPGEDIRDENSTTAHFTVRADGDGTQVTVTETGFDTLGEAAGRRAAMEDNAGGWTSELDEFVAYVESLSLTP